MWKILAFWNLEKSIDCWQVSLVLSLTKATYTIMFLPWAWKIQESYSQKQKAHLRNKGVYRRHETPWLLQSCDDIKGTNFSYLHYIHLICTSWWPGREGKKAALQIFSTVSCYMLILYMAWSSKQAQCYLYGVSPQKLTIALATMKNKLHPAASFSFKSYEFV